MPNAVTYTAYLNGCAIVDAHELALSALSDMLDEAVTPKLKTFEAIVHLADRFDDRPPPEVVDVKEEEEEEEEGMEEGEEGEEPVVKQRPKPPPPPPSPRRAVLAADLLPARRRHLRGSAAAITRGRLHADASSGARGGGREGGERAVGREERGPELPVEADAEECGARLGRGGRGVADGGNEGGEVATETVRRRFPPAALDSDSAALST